MNNLQLKTLKTLSEKISIDKFRELHDCIVQNKVIRFEVNIKDTYKFCKWIKKLSLAFSVGSESFRLLKDGGFENWSSLIQPCTNKDSNAMRFIYMHPKEDICFKAKQLNERKNDFEFGVLLGYPKCCINSYINWLKKKEDIDPITIILESFYFTDQLMHFDCPNPFSRYFGLGLYSHFPCSLSCEETKSIASDSFKMLQINFPIIANKILLFENSLTLFAKSKGIAIWEKFKVNNKRILLEKDSIHGQGEIKSILGTIDEIELTKLQLNFYSAKEKVSHISTKNILFATFGRQ